MLTAQTKQKIDNARDILVGKIPNPIGQVEQITLALLYKFMNDIDVQSKELGGKVKFFNGDYQQYTWNHLMDKSLSAYKRVTLYAEALEKMNLNPNLPQFFRNVFKGAFLPFRDPEVLTLFLKQIDEFSYSHNEELGDAFEYLLQAMGTQGEAGQFLTPRHIINFIVDIVDPHKTDRILDPACGTSGFLISAYQYILKKNIQEGSKKIGSGLTFEDRKKMTDSFVGYDISHDMVRLSLVNMYLHDFSDPKIYEYDTLTSQDRWDDDFDCILTNPPFMTPKGGIRPHKRFAIRANRSELLFVDYIHEHLSPKGKCGIIVPEGVVFHSGGAYKSLRKILVENSLIGVISLPKGVFNPYSGVKTSILILDKHLCKISRDILFINIRNDGYDLGAQREPIIENDLPRAHEIINNYKSSIINGRTFKLNKSEKDIANVVSKAIIEKSGSYNLTYNKYLDDDFNYQGKWPFIELSEIAEFVRGPFGSSIKKSVCVPKNKDTYKVYEQGNVIQNNFNIGEYYIDSDKFKELKRFELKAKDIVVTCAGTLGKIVIVPDKIERGVINSVLMRIRLNRSKVNDEFFVHLFKSNIFQKRITKNATGAGVTNMFATSELKKFKIPLPPLSIQEHIVAEIRKHNELIKNLAEKIKNEESHIEMTIENIWK